jgi:dihydroflavonol-4-reductase
MSSAPKKILVTGATGFVGSAVAREALADGHAVRVLARATSARDNLAGLDVETSIGDLRDADSLARAMVGVNVLIHVAADYRLWARDPADMIRSNVAGTEALMNAAISAGVERIVYTSSVATFRLNVEGTPVDETQPLSEHEGIGVYKRSKIAAERLVERMVAEHGLPAVIVNPSTPIGPRDIKPTPTGRMIVEAARGRMPAYVDTGLNFVHVDDVARGHLAAMAKGRVGERYILGGQNVLLGDFLVEIAKLRGRRPPLMKLPRGILFPFAFGAEAVARLTGKEPFATMDGLRLAKYRMFFSSAKAERELGYVARPHGEALVDALNWFEKAGALG